MAMDKSLDVLLQKEIFLSLKYFFNALFSDSVFRHSQLSWANLTLQCFTKIVCPTTLQIQSLSQSFETVDISWLENLELWFFVGLHCMQHHYYQSELAEQLDADWQHIFVIGLICLWFCSCTWLFICSIAVASEVLAKKNTEDKHFETWIKRIIFKPFAFSSALPWHG